MSMTTDPIADMLTRIRNALTAKHETVEIPASKIKVNIAEILKKEGYIADYEVIESGVQGAIKITLKYAGKNKKVITGLKRISKPGLRVYCESTKIPSVLNGMGIAILSTSQGVMTDKEAREAGCGGIMEPVAVWVRGKGEWAIIHRCRRCGKLSSNRIAADDNPVKLMSIAMRPIAEPPFPIEHIKELQKAVFDDEK